MGAVFCFLLFLAAVGLCILLGQSLILAIWVGIAAFAALGLRRGMTVRAMWDAAWAQGRKMCCVIVIYMLIGAITALWRSAGTIAFFIYHGLRIITPQLFLLVTFLLTSFISYALGTSFGVVGTLGVILMALARSGGVSVAITAGTIVAGAYFGDRCSPASSSATLVAAATDTKLYDNLHMMHRTGWLPYLVSLAAYAALSVTHPLATVDSGVLDQLSGTFSLSWWTAIPALLILILPLCKVPIRPTMAVSALTALLARYHRRAWPSMKHRRFAALNKEERRALSAAASLLRIADALDYRHKGVVEEVRVGLRRHAVRMVCFGTEPCGRECRRALKKGDLFESLYGGRLEVVPGKEGDRDAR